MIKEQVRLSKDKVLKCYQVEKTAMLKHNFHFLKEL